jgi:CDP-diacylglycerol---glycerol-3-phosphate 3-phosphatidyltransferase
VALRSRFPDYVEAVTSPIGRLLARTGITPNWITTLGLVLTFIAAWAVANGMPVAGGWILFAGGVMDTFGGAVARATNRSTPFGGFYDSVSDRISDGVILAGVAWWVADQPRLFLLAVTALVGAEVTSYVRAKAESIDLVCSVGILERAERAVLLMFALVFHRWLLEPVLWVLAVGSVVTVVQRIHHVWCQIDRDLPEEIVALTLQDRAWSRAFKAAARKFYGDRNFDGALDEWTLDARAANERLQSRTGEPRRRHEGERLGPSSSGERRDGSGDAPGVAPGDDRGDVRPDPHPTDRRGRR